MLGEVSNLPPLTPGWKSEFMKFISRTPNLDVVLVSGKTLYNPTTHEVLDTIPALMAKFRLAVYETHDPFVIGHMLGKIKYRENNGITQTYEVHPEDLEAARLFEVKAVPEAVRESDPEKEALKKQVESLTDTVNLLIERVDKASAVPLPSAAPKETKPAAPKPPKDAKTPAAAPKG